MTALTDFDYAAEVHFPLNRRRIPTSWLVAGVAVAAALALTVLYYVRGSGTTLSTDDAMLQADSVPITSRLSGRIAKVVAPENGDVAAGTTLMVLDPQDVDTRLRAADGELAGIRAEAASNRAHSAEAYSAVREARAQFRAAASDYRRLSDEVRRYRPLVAQGAETAEKLAQITGERNRAAAQVAAARAAIDTASARVAGVRSQVGEFSARAEVARAGRDSAASDKQDTAITAPVAGRFSFVLAREGQFVQAGQKLGTVVPVGAIYVLANFKETQIARIRPGQPVRVYLDALPGTAIPGTVESLAGGTKASGALLQPQNASGNFTRVVQRVPVRVRINPPAAVRPLMTNGLSASVEVDTAAQPHSGSPR
ncbi:MAG: HlyD family secretion protein [Proteobacteria bacterium]|nr:HlyD family secretion protein [Pseudomonadota bacterium]